MKKRILISVNNIWPPPVVVTGVSIIYDFIKEVSREERSLDVHILTSFGLWDKDSMKSNIDDLYDVREWFNEQEKEFNIKFHTYNLSIFNKFPRVGFYINRIFPVFIIPFLKFKYKVDILHEFSSTPLLIYRSWLLKVILNIKVYHTIIAESPGILGKYFWVSLFKPRINKVICTSRRILNNFKEAGYPSDCSTYIPLGVNTAKFNNIDNLRNEYKIPSDLVKFLFLGPLEDQKGYIVFVESAIRFLEKNSNAIFIIVTYDSPSKTPYTLRKKRVLSMIEKYSENFIFIEGIVNVPQLLDAVDVFVLPLTSLDGATSHPVTLMEAMYASKIVIVSDLPGNLELVKNDFNGLTFKNEDTKELKDIFLRIVKKFNTYKIYGENAKNTIANKFQISLISNSIIDLYYE